MLTTSLQGRMGNTVLPRAVQRTRGAGHAATNAANPQLMGHRATSGHSSAQPGWFRCWCLPKATATASPRQHAPVTSILPAFPGGWWPSGLVFKEMIRRCLLPDTQALPSTMLRPCCPSVATSTAGWKLRWIWDWRECFQSRCCFWFTFLRLGFILLESGHNASRGPAVFLSPLTLLPLV